LELRQKKLKFYGEICRNGLEMFTFHQKKKRGGGFEICENERQESNAVCKAEEHKCPRIVN
jgi:hypothetical protein